MSGRPRIGDGYDEPSGWETAHLITGGHADFVAGEELTTEEWEQIRRDRDAAPKRLPGFAAWPVEGASGP